MNSRLKQWIPTVKETLAVGDVITLTTDAPREKQAVDQVGIPVLDQNGLEIVVRGVKTDDNLMGPEIMLFLSNQTGQNITVQANDFSINGYMITRSSCDIIDGKVAYTIYLDTEELKRETGSIASIQSNASLSYSTRAPGIRYLSLIL